MAARGRWRWLRWVIAGAVVIVVLAVAVPYIFFHFVEGNTPAPLSLKSATASPSSLPACVRAMATGCTSR